MSLLVGAAQPFAVLQLEDLRLNRVDFRPLGVIFADFEFVAPGTFRTEWWPGSSLMSDGQSPYDPDTCASLLWSPYDQSGSGGASRYGFVGVTRDQFGSPVGNVEVKLVLAETHALIDLTISDPVGNFLLNTPFYPDRHYIVCHKSSGPGISGASANTLIGT